MNSDDVVGVSPLDHFGTFMTSLDNKEQQNPIREVILSFLRSKDDNLILLTLQTIISITENK